MRTQTIIVKVVYFSYTATLATKTFRLLPPWRVLLKRFFEPCIQTLSRVHFLLATPRQRAWSVERTLLLCRPFFFFFFRTSGKGMADPSHGPTLFCCSVNCPSLRGFKAIIQRLETRIGQHIPAWLTKPKTSTNDDDEQPKVTSAIG